MKLGGWKMKILVIGRSIPVEQSGMIGIFEYEQAKLFAKKGNEVTYLFCDTQSIKGLRKIGPYYSNDHVTIYGYFLPIGGLPRKILDCLKNHFLSKLLSKVLREKGDIDLIVIHFPLLSITPRFWQELKNLGSHFLMMEYWSKIQEKQLCNREINELKTYVEESDAFVSIGEQLKESILDLTGSKKEIYVIPFMYKNIFYNIESIKESDRFEFVAVGRLVKGKRFDYLVKAFNQYFSDNKKVGLTIIGGGLEERSLRALVTKYELEDRIEITGFLDRDATANRLKKSQAFISTSLVETFCVPVVEALAAGKPVLVDKNSGVAKYINNNLGLVYDASSVDSIGQALKELYERKDNYNSKDIANFAKEHFNENAIMTKLDEIIKSLV